MSNNEDVDSKNQLNNVLSSNSSLSVPLKEQNPNTTTQSIKNNLESSPTKQNSSSNLKQNDQNQNDFSEQENKREEEEEEETKDSKHQIPDIKVISPANEHSMQQSAPKPYHRTRSDSIKQFRSRFRSFSNDLLRSFENAHEMVDLRNSNFAAVTQSAAVAAQQHRQQQKYLEVPYTRNTTTDQNNKYQQKPSHSSLLNKRHSIVNKASTSGSSLNLGSHSSMLIDDTCNKKGNGLMSQSKSDCTGEILNLNNNNNSYRTNSFNSKFRSNRTINELDIIEDNEIDDTTKNVNKKDDVELKKLDDIDFNNLNNDIDQSESKSKRRKKSNKDNVDFRVKTNGNKKPIPDDIHISILEVFIYLWGVITFFADLISDIILSIEYFNSERRWLGSLTLLFTIVPNVTLSLFSLSWYIDKYYQEKRIHETNLKVEKQLQEQDENVNNLDNTKNPHHHSKITSTCDSITFWITTIFFVIFQLDLVWKYIQGFVYTLKGWACRSVFQNLKWEKYYIEKQIKCDTDIGMLRLIDVFMDSGPQVLLQLYVITTQNLHELGSGNLVVLTFKDFQTTSVELKQLVSILSSLFSMGYALAGYHRCLRNQQFIFCLETNKPLPRPMKWISTIMQFLWYLFLIAPRVLSMALFASTFRSWFFMIIFTHWLIMYFWILRLKTNYCISSQDVYNAREEIFEKFYDFVCSFIYIFVYFNLKAGPTRLRYLIYYLVFYSENVLFSVCYFMFSKEPNFTYKLSMFLIIIFGFWIAITFQMVYYLHCHPSHDIRVCVRKKTKFHFIHKETLKPSNLYESSNEEYEDEEYDEQIIEQQPNETFEKNVIKEKNYIQSEIINEKDKEMHILSTTSNKNNNNSLSSITSLSGSICPSSSNSLSSSNSTINNNNNNQETQELIGDKMTSKSSPHKLDNSNLNNSVKIERSKNSNENVYNLSNSRLQSPDTVVVTSNRKSIFNHNLPVNQTEPLIKSSSSTNFSNSNLIKTQSIEELKNPPLATINELLLTESDSMESQLNYSIQSDHIANNKNNCDNLVKTHVKETNL